MAGFDMDGYLRGRTGNVGADKLQALQAASQEKRSGLLEASRQIEEAKVANANSWVSQLGLDVDSPEGSAVNLAASFASGASRVGGQLAALPADASSMVDEWGMSEQQVNAYNNYLNKKATPEDIAILSQKKKWTSDTPSRNNGKGIYGDAFAAVGVSPDTQDTSPTILEVFERAANKRQLGRDIVEKFDISNVVNKDKRQALSADLGDTFQSSWDQTKKGFKAALKGEVLSGGADTAAGLAKLLYNAGEAAVTNPGASGEYVFENIPQLAMGLLGKAGKAAMATSNIGYAADNYQKGIKGYQANNNGALPPAEMRQEMAMWAASTALAEQAGDVIGLGLMKATGKGAADAARIGFKESLKNAAKAGALATGSEAVTEGYQTFAEGEAGLKPATALQIYEGATIGGIAGGALSGGGRAIAELAGATPEQVKEKAKGQKEIVDLKTAIDTNNAAAYLDPASPTYSPAKAAAVHFGNSQKADTTPEAKEANLTQANKIVTDLESRISNLKDALDTHSPESRSGNEAALSKYTAKLATLDPTDPRAAMLKDAITGFEDALATPSFTPEEVKAKGIEIAKLERELGETRKLKDGLHTLVQPKDEDVAALVELSDTQSGEASTKAADRIIVLAMNAPEKITPEMAQRLVDNTGNSLTEAQRSFLRVFSEAKQAEHALKKLSDVENDIYIGAHTPGKTQYMGIADYNKVMSEAIAAGDSKAAARHLAGLTEFARNHQSKVDAGKAAIASRKPGTQAQIVYNKVTKEWEVAQSVYSKATKKWEVAHTDKEMAALAGFTFSNPARSLNQFEAEANALNAAAASLKAAYELKFNPVVNSVNAAVTPKQPEVVSSVKPVTASNQSNVDSSVDTPKVSTELSVLKSGDKQAIADFYGLPIEDVIDEDIESSIKVLESPSVDRPITESVKEAAIRYAYLQTDVAHNNDRIGTGGDTLPKDLKASLLAENAESISEMRLIEKEHPNIKEEVAALSKKQNSVKAKTPFFKEKRDMVSVGEEIMEQLQKMTDAQLAAFSKRQSKRAGERKTPLEQKIYAESLAADALLSERKAGNQQVSTVVEKSPEKDKTVSKDTRGRTQPKEYDNLVGAILRVTGGKGISATMAVDLTGDASHKAKRVRSAFSTEGTLDIGEVVNRLREEEDYDVKDATHLADLLREHEAGNPVLSNERMREEAARNDEKKRKEYVRDVSQQAKDLGLKGVRGRRTLEMVEADIARVEAERNAWEAEEERLGKLMEEMDSLVQGANESGMSFETIQTEVTNATQSAEASGKNEESAAEISQAETQSSTEEQHRDGETQAGEVSTGEATQVTPEGTLDVLLQEPAPKGTLLKELSAQGKVLSTFLKQTLKREGDVTSRPLVAVKDFFSNWLDDSSSVSMFDYLTITEEGMVDEHYNAIEGFHKYATQWLKDIPKSLAVWNTRKEYLYNDPIQELLITGEDGKPDLPENVKTAMAYAAFSWINEQAARSSTNDDADINKLLNRGEDDLVMPFEKKMLENVLARKNMVANTLGRKVTSALGIKDTADAPINILPSLEAALGAHLLQLMLRKDEKTGEAMLEMVTFTNEELKQANGYDTDSELSQEDYEAKQKREEANDKKPQQFISLARNKKGDLVDTITDIRAANRGSKGILDQLFSVESGIKEPTTEVKDFTQKTTKSGREVTKEQAAILKCDNAQPNTLKQDSWSLFNMLDSDIQVQIATGEWVVEGETQEMRKASIQANNDAMERSIENLTDFVEYTLLRSENGQDSPIYYQHDVWDQNRVGISNNIANPQMDKVARVMFARDSWKNTVDILNPDQFDNFKLRVLEGLKAPTNNEANSETVKRMGDLFLAKENRKGVPALEQKQFALIDAAVDVLVARMKDTDSVDPKLPRNAQEILRAGVMAGGMEMHTYDALIALAQLRIALDSKKTSFDHALIGEIDGVSNGPVMAHLMYGAADSSVELSLIMQKGGIYTEGDSETDYNLWHKNGGRDIYESMTLAADRILTKHKEAAKFQFIYEAVEVFTGGLVVGNTVTSAGRNLSKDPIRPLVFGSSEHRAIESMSQAFVLNIAKKLEKLPDTKEARTKAINALNVMMYKEEQLPPNMSRQDLIDLELSDEQQAAIMNAFKNTYGKAYKEAIREQLGTFLERRKEIIRTSELIFTLYNAMYTSLRNEFIQKELTAGNLDINKEGKPSHDLSRKQEQAFQKSIEHLMPLMHNVFSKREENTDAGFAVFKSRVALSQERQYQPEVHVAGPDGKVVTERPHAMQRLMESVGVRLTSFPIHAQDSATSHLANPNGDMLNLHDAHAGGVDSFTEMGRALNKALWDTSLNYSPLRELTTTLQNTIKGISDLLRRGEKEMSVEERNALIKALGMAIAEFAIKQEMRPEHVLDNVLGSINFTAHTADTNKLGVLGITTVVTQYASEGAGYEVQPEDRAKVVEKQAELEKQYALDEATNIGVTKIKNMAAKDYKAHYDKLWKEVVLKKHNKTVNALTVGQTKQLIRAAMQEEGIADDVYAALKALGSALNAGADSYRIAQSKIELDYEVLNKATTLLGELHNSLEPGNWGERGKPDAKLNDSTLVEMFKNRDVIPAKKLLNYLKTKLAGSEIGMPAFNLALAERLDGLIKEPLNVVYVTTATDPRIVMGTKPVGASKGWYSVNATTGKQEIYILGSEFKDSAINAELLLHEITHSILMQVIAAEQGKNTDAGQLIGELEGLMEDAKKVVDALADTHPNKSVFTKAVADIQEFVAWGMTSEAFQNQVLKQLKVNEPVEGNKLLTIDGFKAFITNLVGLIFGKSKAKNADGSINGLAIFLRDTAGLFNAAEDFKGGIAQSGTQAMAANSVASYTTLDIHAALTNGAVTPAFTDHLKGLLSGIVTQLHGVHGAFKEALQNPYASANDAWLDAKNTGSAPFASKTLTAGFPVSEQEAFVLEQVEATVRAALEDSEGQTTAAYKELSKLFMEARNKLTVADFEAIVANPQEAAKLRDFVFNNTDKANGERSDYLARFAALGLAHEGFNQLLNMNTQVASATTVKQSFSEKLQSLFEQLLDFISHKLTKTYAGQKANDKLNTLVNQLVSIEAKKRTVIAARENQRNLLDPVEEGVKKVTEGLRYKIGEFAGSGIIQNRSSAVIRATGQVVRMVAHDKVDTFMNELTRLRDRQFKGRQGMIAGLLREVVHNKEVLQTLHRAAKLSEAVRKDIITHKGKEVLSVFKAGKAMSKEVKAGITATLLRTGAHVLTKDFSLVEIQELLTDKKKLDQAIKTVEAKLSSPLKSEHIRQANILGLYRATGKVHGLLMLNSYLIARMSGTPLAQKITEKQAANEEAHINTLASLYGIKYSHGKHKRAAAEVMATENARTEGNGVEFTLALHARLEQESKEKLFKGNPALMMHGFTPEILNPNTDIQFANAEEGKELIHQGYEIAEFLPADPKDPSYEPRNIYVLKDGGLSRYVSGAISTTSNGTKGDLKHNGYMNPLTPLGRQNAALQASITSKKMAALVTDNTNPSADLSGSKQVSMAPVYNDKGEIVNWRYLMKEAMKDSLLERDSSFERVLGSMAGSIYDKTSAPEQNRRAIEASYELYQKEMATEFESYVLVGPESADPDLREIWRLLPDETKAIVSDVWNTQNKGMYVRSDSLDITFGYRKHSMANVFKEVEAERKRLLAEGTPEARKKALAILNPAEKAFVMGVEMMMTTYARAKLGMTIPEAENYAKRAAVYVTRGERAWQEVYREFKDIVVVKSGMILVGNIYSNFSTLVLAGVPWKDIVRNTSIAMKGATAYHQDNEELSRYRALLDTGYTQGKEADIKWNINRLEDAIARNPVKKLIDAGLMPTIVDDVESEEDTYSYKSHLTKVVEAKTAWVNPKVKAAAKVVYMAKDTKMYQGLSRITQLSDFTARYALYQHLTTKGKGAVSHEDAIQKASDYFVNYDTPMQKGLQYIDDMGFTPFIKYFLRIQKPLLNLTRENPARVLATLALGNMMNLGPIVLEGSAIAHLGNNPFATGAMQYPWVLDDLGTVQAGLALVK